MLGYQMLLTNVLRLHYEGAVNVEYLMSVIARLSTSQRFSDRHFTDHHPGMYK